VCLYVHNTLQSKLKKVSESVEGVFVTVRIPARPKSYEMTVCSVYRPPSSTVSFWEDFSNDLEDAMGSNGHCIALGDLNTNVLQPTGPQHNHLRALCSEFSLSNVVNQPTRFPTDSCLDLALVSGVIHTTPVSVTPVVEQCSLQLEARLQAMDTECSFDDYVATWIANVKGVIDTHAPLKQVTVSRWTKPRPQPWVTEQLKYLFRKRKQLHRQVLKNRNDSSILQRYRLMRREGTVLNKRLKSKYYQHEFSTMKRNPRAQWALINRLSGRSKPSVPPQAGINDLAQTFSAIVADHHRPCALKHLTPSKSTGSDGIPPSFLKHCATSLAPSLTAIVNESLQEGVVPTSFKLSHITAIHKSGCKSDSKNYRPISLLPVVSKLLERVVHRQLIRYLESDQDHPLLPQEQFAYRARHS